MISLDVLRAPDFDLRQLIAQIVAFLTMHAAAEWFNALGRCPATHTDNDGTRKYRVGQITQARYCNRAVGWQFLENNSLAFH